MAAILTNLHMRTADDLFGGPQGSPRTDKLIAASIQWAERIMTRIDDVFGEVNRGQSRIRSVGVPEWEAHCEHLSDRCSQERNQG